MKTPVKACCTLSSRQYLGRLVHVEIDRPVGCTHPTHTDMVYPINYGYVANTVSGDGEELDAYIIGIDYPLSAFEGRCIALVERQEESDDKLVVVADGQSYCDEEIERQIEFQEKYFSHKIIR